MSSKKSSKKSKSSIEKVSYAFANKIGQRVSTSFLDPYDAYANKFPSSHFSNRLFVDNKVDEEYVNYYGGLDKYLCLIFNKKVVYILDTKLISSQWALECCIKTFVDRDDIFQPNKFTSEVLKFLKASNITKAMEISNFCDSYSVECAAYSAYSTNELMSAFYAYESVTNIFFKDIKIQRLLLQSIIDRSFMLDLINKKLPKDLLENVGRYL